MRTELSISGMTCGHCASSLEQLLRARSGVSAATVHYADGMADVEHDPERISPEHLVNLVEAEGYEATLNA